MRIVCKSIILTLFIGFGTLVTAQTGSIDNLSASQRPDGSQIVDITYDLTGTEAAYTITAEVSFNGGAGYLPILTATGDIGGGVTPGIGKLIQWQIGFDYPNLFSDSTRIHLTAESGGDWPVTMVTIPGGSFEMGDIWNAGWSNELPVHTVTLSSFAISATEITNQQYADYLTEALANGEITASSSSVTGPWEGGGSYEYLDLNGGYSQISYSGGVFTVDSGKEDHPVIEVSWYGATAFAEHYGGRLPTEAEWEYAARGIAAGVDTKWSGTSSESALPDYAWYSANWDGDWEPEAVATKLPNANGLYDMSGNVWEWCSDWYSSGYYDNSPDVDPQGPESGSSRVLRGGYYYDDAPDLRCSDRGSDDPSDTHGHIGFRISRTN